LRQRSRRKQMNGRADTKRNPASEERKGKHKRVFLHLSIYDVSLFL